MSLGYVIEQRKMEFTVTASFIALAISTFIILAAMPVQQPVTPPGMKPPGTLLANVFAANSEASASSTIYSFAFTATTISSISAIEITTPAGYDIEGSGFIGGLDEKFSSFEISQFKMKVVFREPISLSAGSHGMIEIGGINNPPAPGFYTFTITTIKSDGSILESGKASINLKEPTISQNSIKAEHIRDGAITTAKIADESINLDKLGPDAFSFFVDQYALLERQIIMQIDNLQAELGNLIQSEESARIAADNDEALARTAEDENIQDQIQELNERIEDLEEEVNELHEQIDI